METNPRIERLTREALGGPYQAPEIHSQPQEAADMAKWNRVRGILAAVILGLFAFGLWTLGLVAAIRPFA